jgi:hypothetical protein
MMTPIIKQSKPSRLQDPRSQGFVLSWFPLQSANFRPFQSNSDPFRPKNKCVNRLLPIFPFRARGSRMSKYDQV